MARPRRNDPCPCGSGLKFKRCCGAPDRRRARRVQEAPEPQRSAEVNFSHLVDLESFPRPQPSAIPLIQTAWQGKRVRAVWNRVFLRPLNEGLGEFALYVLKRTLGKAWYTNEVAQDPEERHQIVKWFFDYFEWQKENMKPENAAPGGGWSAKPNGQVKALLCLAEEVFDLQSVDRLPRKLVKRLKNPASFQGARYEIAVAAMFARLGYTIEWLDERDKRHCELVAIHNETGVRVACEAKSRHRAGLLGQAGDYDPEASLRADVRGLLRKALRQAPGDLPFVIFIDLNAPPTPGIAAKDKPWFEEFKLLVSEGGKPTPDNPDPFNAVFLTNYAYHHMGTRDATASREYLCCVSSHPQNPLPSPRFVTELLREVEGYGRARPKI